MKIYTHPLSGAGFKVTAVLHELALPAELITVDFAKGQHKEPWYLAMNPNGKAPVLVDGDLTLWESNAILTYLGAKVPERGLMPTDPRGMAEVQKWMHWHSYCFYNDTFKVAWNTYYSPIFGHKPDEKALAEGLELTKRDLAVLEEGLKGREYVAGKLSVADFSLATCLLVRDSMKVDLKPFPNVLAWMERMEARPSMQKTKPKM